MWFVVHRTWACSRVMSKCIQQQNCILQTVCICAACDYELCIYWCFGEIFRSPKWLERMRQDVIFCLLECVSNLECHGNALMTFQRICNWYIYRNIHIRDRNIPDATCQNYCELAGAGEGWTEQRRDLWFLLDTFFLKISFEKYAWKAPSVPTIHRSINDNQPNHKPDQFIGFSIHCGNSNRKIKSKVMLIETKSVHRWYFLQPSSRMIHRVISRKIDSHCRPHTGPAYIIRSTDIYGSAE